MLRQKKLKYYVLKTFFLTIIIAFITLVLFSVVEHFQQKSRAVKTVLEKDYTIITTKERRALKEKLEQLLVEIDLEINQGDTTQPVALSDDLTNQIISLSNKLQPEVLEGHNGIAFLQSTERGQLFKKVVSSNIDHLSILQKGNFKYALLDHIDLTSKTLTGINLKGAFLRNAKLNGVDLSGASLNNATMDKVSMRYSKLVGISLTNSRVKEVDFSYSDLSKSYLTGANIRYSTMLYTDLTGANLVSSILSQSNLSHSTINNATLNGSNIYKTDLSNSTLTKTDLSSVYAYFTNMNHTVLTNCDFNFSRFTSSTFLQSNLSKSTFKRSTFLKVNFQGSILRKTLFSASYQQSSFKNVDFSGSNLYHANNIPQGLVDWNAPVGENIFTNAVFDYTVIGERVFQYVKEGDNSTIKSMTKSARVDPIYSPKVIVLSENPPDTDLEAFQQHWFNDLKSYGFDPTKNKE